MLALIGFGVVVCVIMGIYLVQTFGKVLARLDAIEERLDALSLSEPDGEHLLPGRRLPPPHDG